MFRAAFRAVFHAFQMTLGILFFGMLLWTFVSVLMGERFDHACTGSRYIDCD